MEFLDLPDLVIERVFDFFPVGIVAIATLSDNKCLSKLAEKVLHKRHINATDVCEVASWGNLDALKLVFRKDLQVVLADDYRKKLASAIAYGGNPKIFEFFFHNLRDKFGSAFLEKTFTDHCITYAVKWGSPFLLRDLLDRYNSGYHQAAMHIAARKGHVKCLKHLWRKSFSLIPTLLHLEIISGGNLQCILLGIENFPGPFFQSHNKKVPPAYVEHLVKAIEADDHRTFLNSVPTCTISMGEPVMLRCNPYFHCETARACLDRTKNNGIVRGRIRAWLRAQTKCDCV